MDPMDYIKYILFILAAVVLIACSSDSTPSSGSSTTITLDLGLSDVATDAGGSEWTIGSGVTIPPVDDLSVRLTAANGGATKTWDVYSNFPQRETLAPGAYIIEAYYGDLYQEGYDSPYFYVSQQLQLRAGTTENVTMEATLANVMVYLDFTDAFRSRFPGFSAQLHATGGRYLIINTESEAPLFVTPGMVSLLLALDDDINVCAVLSRPFSAGHMYHITVDEQGDVLKVVTDDPQIPALELPCDAATLAAPAPEAVTHGFTSSSVLQLIDGQELENAVGVDFTASAPIVSLPLTIDSPTLRAKGITRELDLASDPSSFIALGAEVKVDGTSAKVDFTSLLRLIEPADGDTRLTLVAIDAYGRASSVVVLLASYQGAEITLQALPSVSLGDPTAWVKVYDHEPLMAEAITLRQSTDTGEMQATPFTAEAIDDNGLKLTFEPINGSADLTLEVTYNGLNTATTVYKRVAPDFTIEVDPFATYALIKIVHADENVVKAICELAEIEAGSNVATILRRAPEYGYIVITGIDSNRTYPFRANALPGNSTARYCPIVYATTESQEQIPAGDFEEQKLSEEVRKLPAGGRYSQTHVGVYNHKNLVDYDIYLPKEKWAGTNAKTHSGKAKTRNTWYIQPSSRISSDAKSGTKSIQLTSVGWDLDGEAIPDYAQVPGEFLPYNPNQPNVAHRAAGKAFLGSYEFNHSTLEETYKEGIDFYARPSGLVGYYKYLPTSSAPDDCGLVVVELLYQDNWLDEPVVVSHVEQELTASAGWTTFTVPLRYEPFGPRPNRLKVMFASTTKVGDIEYEDANVPLTVDLPNSRLTGSELWIDNISFAY
ncbi:MAG: DUF4493 domain-containing protein [Bacteroidales bacterium]|nr:DUF4493 domain-containing protein [Bacteroidales bacterium]